MSNVIITNSRLGSGKRGVLKTMPGTDDTATYYEIVVGAFNIMSEKSEFYDFNASIKNLFDNPQSYFRLMGESGRLRGEIEHPFPEPGMSPQAYLNRVRIVRNNLTSHQFRKLRLEPGKDHKGNTVMLVIGEVTGSGPYMEPTNVRLKNRDENIDFSGRFLTTSRIVNGIIHKEVQLIATYDQVNMGGIGTANKYSTPSLESMEDALGSDVVIDLSRLRDDTPHDGVSMESGLLFDTTMIKDACGWNRVQIVRPRTSLDWQ